MNEPLECELCPATFEPGGLVPICNLCWNKMADERNRYKAALEAIANDKEGPFYPDGDPMGEAMCAKIALGRNCPQCGANTVPCAFHGSTE